MPEENAGKKSRRTVLTTIAGAGATGLLATPGLAASDDADDGEDGFEKGPVATARTQYGLATPAGSADRLSYDELEEVLNGPDNGDVELVDGDVRNERIYVGDDRNVSIEEIQRRFAQVPTTDSGFALPASADSGTWTVDCRTIPYINETVCTEVTFNVYTWGIEADLVVYGYPVWGGGVGYSDGAASFKFNVPGLPVKGEATIGASQIGGCDASLDVDVDLSVYSRHVATLSGSRTVSYC